VRKIWNRENKAEQVSGNSYACYSLQFNILYSIFFTFQVLEENEIHRDHHHLFKVKNTIVLEG